MGLSCSCDEDGDIWYYGPDDFTTLQTSKRKRCASCRELISIGAPCLKFDFFRSPVTDVEERIYGETVPMADRFLCEKCGEIYLNLDDAGYCYSFGDDLRANLREYHEMTGFVGA